MPDTPVFDEYFFGQVGAHAFADELSKLQAGHEKLAQWGKMDPALVAKAQKAAVSGASKAISPTLQKGVAGASKLLGKVGEDKTAGGGLLPKDYLQKAKQVGQLAKKGPTAVPPLKGALGAAKQYITTKGKPKI